jgi:hypothetical protein
MSALRERVAAELTAPLPPEIRAFARHLGERAGAGAVLFYGSVLRTGRLEDLLDFYVLGDRRARGPLIWPEISFEEIAQGARTLRAKVATMPLATFADAAAGRRLDTTIWTRFCQPGALAWSRDAAAAEAAIDAVTAAIATAARYAAALGPATGSAAAFWTGLFDRTYQAELRVEAPGRSATIVAHAPGRYADLLPLAWRDAGIAFRQHGEKLTPDLPAPRRRALLAEWRRRAILGRPLNIVRLIKAGLTLHDAGSYALWKIERHTGLRIEATRWQRRHPLLATPGVLWQLFRGRS